MPRRFGNVRNIAIVLHTDTAECIYGSKDTECIRILKRYFALYRNTTYFPQFDAKKHRNYGEYLHRCPHLIEIFTLSALTKSGEFSIFFSSGRYDFEGLGGMEFGIHGA